MWIQVGTWMNQHPDAVIVMAVMFLVIPSFTITIWSRP